MSKQPPPTSAATSAKQTALEFLRQCSAGHAREAFHKYAGPGFRHHNPYFADDPDTLANAMDENAEQNPHKVFEILRALEDGDLVAVHSRLRMQPDGADIAVVHILRFANDRVVELWDIGVAAPKKSPNEHGMF
jgi:predicted SnoaL-like aldol condensation-catalyzing enzyme